MEIYVGKVSGKGRGVFAARDFKKGDLVEKAPVIVITEADADLIEKTTLTDYYYKWGDTDFAVVLGYGSLYNHSAVPNLSIKRDIKDGFMLYRAKETIHKDQELTIDYVCDLWFDPVD